MSIILQDASSDAQLRAPRAPLPLEATAAKARKAEQANSRPPLPAIDRWGSGGVFRWGRRLEVFLEVGKEKKRLGEDSGVIGFV